MDKVNVWFDGVFIILIVVFSDERYIHPQQEQFSIQLISPVSWEAIPNTRWEAHSHNQNFEALKSS